jgi:gas vesicle protein GvpN
VTTVLRASPRRFVSTPSVERIANRALRYLQSGYSVHLRGPAGTGKTTLALHLADLLARPIMLIFGDDEFKTSDLIGNQSGYTRKKVVDNFIHSVIKVEDELRQNWVDSRLTLACREGFTLVYDEFNRSRPEVNNVLLSALEEKLLVLPPSNNRSEYIRVNPHFRAIFTSNPGEYVGVHATQDALMDRLVTINIPEPDELTQQEILVQKTEIDRASALLIVRLVQAFRAGTNTEKSSGLRSCLMLAKVCRDHEILVSPENVDFREVCSDVLLSRAGKSFEEATKVLWDLLNHPSSIGFSDLELLEKPAEVNSPESVVEETLAIAQEPEQLLESAKTDDLQDGEIVSIPYEQEILNFLKQSAGARLTQIERALKLDRFQTVDSLRMLIAKGTIVLRDRLYQLTEVE